jgi:serine phosphatase RsbU (regulator of sigma subunit)/Tfp pilus assembly protein PilF
MTYLNRILILVLLFICIISSAQDSETDSLRALLLTGQEDTARVNNLIALSSKLSWSSPLEAIKLSTEAKDLAEQLNFQKGVAYALKYTGMGHYFKGQYPETINNWKQSLATFESINDSAGVANMLSNLGAVYNNMGDDARALELYLKSLKISEEINDSLRLLTVMINIGLIYLKNPATHDKAMQYYLEALPLSEELGNLDAIGTASVNLGEIYFEKGDYTIALTFFEKSLESFEKSKTGNVPYTLSNIGKVYAKRGNYDEAIKYQQEAYNMARKLDARLDMTQTLLGLADTYKQKGDIESALTYFKRALQIAQEIGATYELREAYKGLAHSYSELSDYKNAFIYQDLLTSIMDTLYTNSEKTQKRINLLQIELKTEAMERENVILKRDVELKESRNQQQKLIIYLFVLGFVFITIFIILFVRAYNQKRRTNLELEKKNILITEQKKEITASIEYARKIQNAILTPGDFIASLLPERFILFRPRDIVSGDFYWLTKKKDKIICVVADCTGHGVPGAFMSMLGITLLNEIVSKNVDFSANEILDELRILLIKSLRQTGREGEILDGIDIILLILDLEQQTVEFAGAHNSFFLLRDGEINEYKADPMPIGYQATIHLPFRKQLIQLNKGDVLYASTDGFVDQFGGPKGKRFMLKNFKTLLREIYNKSMDEQKELLNETLDNWMTESSQIDDILVMGIRI